MVAGDNTPLAEPTAPISYYSVPNHTDATYNWIISDGNIVSGQGTSQIGVQWTGDYEGNLNMTESNAQNCAIGSGMIDVDFEKEQDIAVETGWNLISFYMVPPNPDVGPTLTTISGVLELVKDEFGVYFHNQNPIFNSLDDFENGQGYWVRTTDNSMIEQQGLALKPETVAISLQAAPTWNLIGYPCQSPQDVQVALASISDNLVQIKNIDEFYDPSFPPIFNTLDQMQPGSGYWIQVNAPVTLYFPRPAGAGNFISVETRSTPAPLPDNWKRIAYPK